MSYVISIFVFLLTYFIFPENIPYILNNLFSHFFVALPSFIYAFSISDFEELMEVQKRTNQILNRIESELEKANEQFLKEKQE